MTVVAEWDFVARRPSRGCDPCTVWHSADVSTGSLRSRLCGMRRSLRGALDLLSVGVDGLAPNRYDLPGGKNCLIGVVFIMYWPR
jgi:hypothetical protein